MDKYDELVAEIERLKVEVDLGKARWEAERQAHEVTMKALDGADYPSYTD